MKSLLKFLGVIVVFFVWVELINLSFYLMDFSDTYIFYGGFLLLSLITVGPMFYFCDNIAMFLKNMKGVFFDKEENNINK
jgi:hypothetical protein